MALQDGLLSFAIKETIFLSSDKAGIGELQELELVPDVEVLENETYISITGCLQLFGKYEPIREAAEANSGGTETLVEAMTFSPFRQEATEEGFYGWEEQIGHRIPLNITIPLERIAEIGDIYAIVDSFDYKLESPHQMLIDAELKIMGIAFAEQAQAQVQEPEQQIHPQLYDQNEETVQAGQEEAWAFAHVASEEQENEVQPVSLDEIEQKLSELETRWSARQCQPHMTPLNLLLCMALLPAPRPIRANMSYKAMVKLRKKSIESRRRCGEQNLRHTNRQRMILLPMIRRQSKQSMMSDGQM